MSSLDRIEIELSGGCQCGAVRYHATERLGVHNSVASRLSYGGTAPVRVREQVARWQEVLG